MSDREAFEKWWESVSNKAYTEDERQAAIAGWQAALSTSADADHVRVPVEMTEEMRKAFWESWTEYEDDDDGEIIQPDHAWDCMLNAAKESA